MPYYLGLPIVAAVAYGAAFRAPAWLLRLLLVAAGLLMLYGFGLAIRNAGVEWAFWPAPPDCGAVDGRVDTGGAGILDAIDAVMPPSCDRAPWRFLGLSFAGWNVLTSLALAVLALRGGLMRAAD